MAEPRHPLYRRAHRRGHGCGERVGLAAAQAFAARGLRVVLADLPGEALERAASDLEAAGASVKAVAIDVGDAAAMERLPRPHRRTARPRS